MVECTSDKAALPVGQHPNLECLNDVELKTLLAEIEKSGSTDPSDLEFAKAIRQKLIGRWMEKPIEIDLTTIRLEKLKYCIRTRLGHDLAIMPEIEFEQLARFASDEILCKIRGFVYGRETEHVKVEYPADWWQAFKERWFPAWARKRWPVRWERKELIARELYPKLAGRGASVSLEIRDYHE